MQEILQQYGQMIAFGILMLLLVRQSVDFGSVFAWLHASMPRMSAAPQQSVQVDREAEALRCNKFLLKYFADNKCKAGLAAAKTCGQHLLDHGDEVAE